MKVFISQPMSGLNDEEIIYERLSALSALSENYPEEDFEADAAEVFIKPDKYEEMRLMHRHGDNAEKFISLFYFLRSIQYMIECDKIVFIDNWYNSRGCCLEYLIARMFDIPRMILTRETNDDGEKVSFKITTYDDNDDLLTIPLVLKFILNKIHIDNKKKRG